MTNEIKTKSTLTVIDREDAKRLGMELEGWNIYFFVRHEGKEYAVEWNPSSASRIDEDFHYEVVNEWEGEE